VGTGFSKEIMLKQQDRADDDSKKSHHALASDPEKMPGNG
jgi:hypothetical protein